MPRIFSYLAGLVRRREEGPQPQPLRRRQVKHARRVRRDAPSIGSVIRICPGGRHAWFSSSVGPLRKPVKLG